MARAYEKHKLWERLVGRPVRVRRSKYLPHQNRKECARRLTQAGLESADAYVLPPVPAEPLGIIQGDTPELETIGYYGTAPAEPGADPAGRPDPS